MQKIRILLVITTGFIFSGCISSDYINIGKRTIYPCSIGCGNENMTAPKGFVYYQNRLMSIDEFNRITHQNVYVE